MQLKNVLKSTLAIALTMPLNVLGKGRVSMYSPAPSHSDPPSCGSDSQYIVDYYVALNSNQLDKNKSYYCGKCVKIVYNNKYLVGRITDRCPGCGNQGLDISPAMFTHFEKESAGIMYADWSIVSCDLYGKKGVCPDSSCNISGSSSSTKPKSTTTQAPKPKPTTTQAPKPKSTTTQASKPKPTTTQASKPITQTQPKPVTTQTQPKPVTTANTTTSSSTTQQNTTTTTTQQNATSVDGTVTTTEGITNPGTTTTTEAATGVEATVGTPVLENTAGDVKIELKEPVDNEGKNKGSGNIIMPLTGVIMVSGAAGAGLLYLKKNKKYQNFPDTLKGLKRSLTNGASIRRNITRTFTKRRNDILPTTNTTSPANAATGEVKPTEMDICESRITVN
ncbi:hypothetical protein BCR36DRAFT_340406 [Piromyces finnis]|uniref:Barwin domain-containing protein n=1 Tax=Piromyces finnis TaxID=1754191 RepID=A0A1Y1UA35_9FUNG|nr:hypothetical protein BCR36DRAFT_340406 [Piromyces finnis]|eukprot:ORX34893.1 hypothetical protein BCR36DRAFT_340406 [Piromyces finnis]